MIAQIDFEKGAPPPSKPIYNLSRNEFMML